MTKLILFMAMFPSFILAQNLFPEQQAQIDWALSKIRQKRAYVAHKDVWGEKSYKLIKLNSHFTGADKASEFPAHYLNEGLRIKYRLKIQNGKIWDSRGNEFDTRGTRGAQFVMMENGDIYASRTWKRLTFEHDGLAGGNSVVCAGYLIVHNGRLKRIDDLSAQYPAKNYYPLTKVITHFKKYGVSFNQVKVIYGLD